MGPRVERERFDDLSAALDALEARMRAAAPGATARAAPHSVMGREFAPVQQVIARAELAGRRLRAGCDLRGDGSLEAWSGRLRRRVLEPLDGEDVYETLRRTLSENARQSSS